MDVADELVDEIIEYFADPHSKHTILAAMRLLEKNSLNVNFMFESVHGHLTDPRHSPIPEAKSLPLEQERLIMIAVRDKVRHELGLPPLDDETKRDWYYGPVKLRKDRRSEPLIIQGRPPPYKSTVIERRAVAEKAEELEPGILQALDAFKQHNAEAAMGSVVSTLWAYYHLLPYADEEMPHLDGLEAHDFTLALLQDYAGW